MKTPIWTEEDNVEEYCGDYTEFKLGETVKTMYCYGEQEVVISEKIKHYKYRIEFEDGGHAYVDASDLERIKDD